jgi:tRNA (guanine10-N2)-methyltransferase
MRDAEQEFRVFEDYELGAPRPSRILFGRLIGSGSRDILNTYTLKKRKYISTTSMDAELALVMANLTLAAPGKLFHDPFVGTGSLSIGCSHFGATSMGSDLDGRTLRGKNGFGIRESFGQYALQDRWLDGFIADLTHSALRSGRASGGLLDGIVCDPPYGIREGLKVLGSKDGGNKEVIWIDGDMAHL